MVRSYLRNAVEGCRRTDCYRNYTPHTYYKVKYLFRNAIGQAIIINRIFIHITGSNTWFKMQQRDAAGHTIIMSRFLIHTVNSNIPFRMQPRIGQTDAAMGYGSRIQQWKKAVECRQRMQPATYCTLRKRSDVIMTVILVTHSYCKNSNTVRSTVLITVRSKVPHLVLVQYMGTTVPKVSTLCCATYTSHTQMTSRKHAYLPYFCIALIHYV